MKIYLSIALLLLVTVQNSFAAVGVTSVGEARASAQPSNVNGVGFNPERAAQLTDGATTNGTSTTPTVSSATENCSATPDTNAYMFIQSGTNWIPGWYKITGCSGNNWTLDASVGSAILYTSGAKRSFTLNTVAGVATASTPGGNASFMVDFTQQDAATLILTDGANLVTTTNLTSVTGGFRKVMVGNWVHVNSITGVGCVTDWYEITSVTSTNTAVIDSPVCPSNSGVSAAFRVGGAGSLATGSGATDDSLFEKFSGTNGTGAGTIFIKLGTYSTMGAVAIAAAGGTQTHVKIVGYSALRTDAPVGTNRPLLSFGASNAFTLGSRWDVYNIRFTGSAASNFITEGTDSIFWNSRVEYANTSAGNALTGSSNSLTIGNEIISYRGTAYLAPNAGNQQVLYNYIHDSDIGMSSGNGVNIHVIGNLFKSIKTTAIAYGAGTVGGDLVLGNTFVGDVSNNQLGTGVSAVTAVSAMHILNNIFTGLTTGITSTDTASSSLLDYNDYFQNTTDVSGISKGAHTLALDPQFVGVTRRSGSNATTISGNRLVQTGATFVAWGITAGVDVLYLASGTGPTTGIHYSILSVDSDTQITVGETLTANGSTDKSWVILQGNNYAVGANMKAIGFPGAFGSTTTGATDLGAVQRVESTGGGIKGFTFAALFPQFELPIR